VGRAKTFFALGAILACAFATLAHEPDGRFAFRYAWIAPEVDGAPRTLHLTVTANVSMSDVEIDAIVPKATKVKIRSLVVPGRATSALEGPWPSAGLPLGTMAAGTTIAFDLDVIEPSSGGGFLSIGCHGRIGDRPVAEGVGIAVGTPGTAPRLRDGVAEFPAEPSDRSP
jgi:hypothetical protein